jgi:hypothetical protein
MMPGQRLDLGHAVDVIAGGAIGPRRLEHAWCNRAAGQLIAAAHRKARRARERTPDERAEHAHREGVRMRREAREARERLASPGPGRVW